MRIGFIGVGVMGGAMVENLLKNGHEVSVFSRTKEKCEGVIALGAVWTPSVMECAHDRELVITMVGMPSDVEEVYFGQYGILENAEEGALLVDMTTSSPKLARRISAAARERGLTALDAPVSGGDTGAKAGTLTIMAGGDRGAFDKLVPVFSCMGKNIRYAGESGMGQHCKMANQIAIAGALAGVGEAVAYAQAVGLDARTMLDAVSTGAAGSWQMSNNAPKMIDGDYAPGFYIKHFIKDMRLADEEALSRGHALPVLEQVLAVFQALAEAGRSDEGTQAIIRAYREGLV